MNFEITRMIIQYEMNYVYFTSFSVRDWSKIKNSKLFSCSPISCSYFPPKGIIYLYLSSWPSLTNPSSEQTLSSTTTKSRLQTLSRLFALPHVTPDSQPRTKLTTAGIDTTNGFSVWRTPEMKRDAKIWSKWLTPSALLSGLRSGRRSEVSKDTDLQCRQASNIIWFIFFGSK